MDKTSAVKLLGKITLLKPLFPVLLGFLFILSLGYILYIYESHEKVNTYAHTLESRNLLLEKYQIKYAQMVSELSSVGNSRPSSENLVYLESADSINNELLEIANGIYSVSTSMKSAGVGDEMLVSAYIKADSTRILLHQNLKNFLEGQKLIAQYLMVKSESESCFNDVNLGSTDYSQETIKIKRCLNLLSRENSFILDLAENFTVTSDYLTAYSKYWSTVLDIFEASAKNEIATARQKSEVAQSMLGSVNELGQLSEEELNSVMVNNPREEVEKMGERLKIETEEISVLENSI